VEDAGDDARETGYGFGPPPSSLSPSLPLPPSLSLALSSPLSPPLAVSLLLSLRISLSLSHFGLSHVEEASGRW